MALSTRENKEKTNTEFQREQLGKWHFCTSPKIINKKATVKCIFYSTNPKRDGIFKYSAVEKASEFNIRFLKIILEGFDRVQ